MFAVEGKPLLAQLRVRGRSYQVGIKDGLFAGGVDLQQPGEGGPRLLEFVWV